MRTDDEIDQLIALARTYCETRAKFVYAQAEGRLSADDEIRLRDTLQSLDKEIERLKSSNEVDRRRGKARNNVISLRNIDRKQPRVQPMGLRA